MITRRALIVGFVVAACKREEKLPTSCADTTALSSDEANARTSLGYVDSTQTEKTCVACAQWVAPKDASECGGCKLLKGPIHPRGTCKAFAPKA